MKILYINHYAGSPQMGMEFRPYYLATEWVRNGHEVRVIACRQSHLRKKTPSGSDLDCTDVDGVQYQWINSFQYHGNGPKRLLNILAFVAKLSWYSRRIEKSFKPDLVIASSTYPLDVPVAWRIAKRSRAVLVHEVHDLWPLTLTAINGMSRWNPFVLLLQWAENFSYKYCDRVVSMLPGALKYMKEHGLTASRFCTIPNGVDLREWERLAKSNKIESKSDSSEFVLGYAGYHGSANDLESLVRAMKIACEQSQRPLRLHLLGDGPLKKDLVRLVSELSLTSVVRFFDAVSKERVPGFLAETDAVFIGAPRHALYQYGISPNKLLDYMMAGKPILQAIEAYNDWVTEKKCGLTVTPESPEAIAKGILTLAKMDSEQLQKMGENGRDFVTQEMNYQVLARRFLDESMASSKA